MKRNIWATRGKVRKENDNRGTVSVEAAITMMLFFLCFSCLWNILDFYITIGRCQRALTLTAKEISYYSAFAEEGEYYLELKEGTQVSASEMDNSVHSLVGWDFGFVSKEGRSSNGIENQNLFSDQSFQWFKNSAVKNVMISSRNVKWRYCLIGTIYTESEQELSLYGIVQVNLIGVGNEKLIGKYFTLTKSIGAYTYMWGGM